MDRTVMVPLPGPTAHWPECALCQPSPRGFGVSTPLPLASPVLPPLNLAHLSNSVPSSLGGFCQPLPPLPGTPLLSIAPHLCTPLSSHFLDRQVC